MSDLGLIQVYTGDGKGKTTASLGLALRACGHGLKVCMIQFMKKDENYGEWKSGRFLPNFKIYQVGRNDFVDLENPSSLDIKLARDGWDRAKNIIQSMEYDIIILDELNVVLACKMINTESVVNFLHNVFTKLSKPPELIFTGRYAPKEIIAIADLVTEVKEIKHYYHAGVESRPGVDY